MTQFSPAVSEPLCGCNGFTLSSYPISLSALRRNTGSLKLADALFPPRTLRSIAVDWNAPRRLSPQNGCLQDLGFYQELKVGAFCQVFMPFKGFMTHLRASFALGVSLQSKHCIKHLTYCFSICKNLTVPLLMYCLLCVFCGLVRQKVSILVEVCLYTEMQEKFQCKWMYGLI